MMLRLGGDWSTRSESIPVFSAQSLAAAGHRSLAMDASGVERWDSGLIAFLWDVKRATEAAGYSLDPQGLPAAARTLLGLLPNAPVPAAPSAHPRFAPLARLGETSLGAVAELGIVTLLLTATTQGAVRALAGRARMRAVDLLGNISDAGPSALMIVSVVNFLIGAI